MVYMDINVSIYVVNIYLYIYDNVVNIFVKYDKTINTFTINRVIVVNDKMKTFLLTIHYLLMKMNDNCELCCTC